MKRRTPYHRKYRGPRTKRRGYVPPKLVDLVHKFAGTKYHDDMVDTTAYAIRLLSIPNNVFKDLP